MRFLAENGYRTLSLGDAIKLLGGETPRGRNDGSGRKKNGRPVVITFDDGFRDFYSNAFPILQEFGFTATMFLPTAFIGDERRLYAPKIRSRSVRPKSIGRECLTWKEVQELHQLGIEMGSHTVNHPRMVELTWREIELEIQNSKFEIEMRIGVPVTTFAYPYAFPQADRSFVARFRDLLEGAGYNCNVTTEIGRSKTGDDLYRLKRLPVNSCDDLQLFRAKLEGDYDWLAIPQSLSKTIMRWTKNPAAIPVRMPLPALPEHTANSK
jgi:peptidoglycan/xylan/chitin deacetylase (PgdA/CDA1 family)